MPKFALMAIAAAFAGAALVGPAQATNKPELPGSLLLAQSQVPAECAALQNPAERQKCIEEKEGKK